MEICNNESCDEVAGRRLAEQRLLERERRYHDILHNLSDAIYLVEVTDDVRFRYLETNRAFETMMGVAEDSMLGKYVGDLLRSSGAEASAESAVAKFRRCLELGHAISGEITLDTPSGRRILNSTLTPLPDEAGRINRILGVSRDITESKLTERLNDFLSYALDQANDALFLIDPADSYRFLYVNEQACRSLGYSRDELLSMSVLDIDPVMDAEGARKVDEQMLKQGFICFETFHRRKDSYVFPVEICGTEFEHDGQTMGLAIVRDISERKRMEEERLGHLRFFESMDRVNRVIQGSNDLETVLNDVLDTVLAIFDCDRAFLIYPCDPQADAWSVPFERTRQEYPGALALGVSIPMNEDIAVMCQAWLDSNGPVTAGPGNQRPLTTDCAEKFGYKSYMATAIYPKGDKSWGFGIHQCSSTRAWTPKEQKMFQEIGWRITDSLTNLLAFREVREREQKFSILADSMPDSICLYDLQMRKIYANLKLRRILAADFGNSWLGKTPKELYLNGSMNEHQARLEQVIETGASEDWEGSMPDAEYGRRYFQTRYAALRDYDGKIIGALAIFTYITRQRQLELELIRSEREFRTLAENLPDYIARYDLKARKTYASPKLQQLLGGNIDAWIGKTPKEVNPDGEYDAYQAKLEGTLRTGQGDDLEHLMPDGNGGWRYFHIRFVPERGPDGEIVGALAIGRDVTKKRQLELELIRNERKFRTLVKNSPGFIARFDTELRRTYVNQVYEETTKTSEGEVLGKTPLEYWRLTVPDAEEFCAILRRVMATRQQERIEAHAITVTGEIRYFTMHMVPEFDDDGEIDGVLTTGIEITDMKNAERLKVEAREDERKMLARELHDDLGQRLTALRLDVALLELRFGNGNSELLAKIKEMDAAVGESVKIVRSLLNMLRPAILDLGLAPALEWLAAEFQKRTGTECSLRLPKQNPSLNEAQSIAMFRIVQESLTNIIKYAQANKISIDLTQEKGGYRLEIQDDGKGFDLGGSKKTGAFGLKGIAERVQMLGGKLIIESAPGCGVKLAVQLPG